MHSALSTLSVYDDAYELKQKMIDEQMYIMSCYTYQALQTALFNFGLGFDSKHTRKPKDFLDKPFLQEHGKKTLDEMTDEELDLEIEKAIMIEQQYMNNSKLPKTRISGR